MDRSISIDEPFLLVKKTDLLLHVRSRKYRPQTIGREERYHGSLKLECLYRVLPSNRRTDRRCVELTAVLQLRAVAHQPGVPHAGCGVFNKDGQKH